MKVGLFGGVAVSLQSLHRFQASGRWTRLDSPIELRGSWVDGPKGGILGLSNCIKLEGDEMVIRRPIGDLVPGWCVASDALGWARTEDLWCRTVTCDALLPSSFLFLLVRPLLLEAMHLFLVASSSYSSNALVASGDALGPEIAWETRVHKNCTFRPGLNVKRVFDKQLLGVPPKAPLSFRRQDWMMKGPFFVATAWPHSGFSHLRTSY